MGFIENLIMSMFAKKAVKEIAKEFSDERPMGVINGGSKATYRNLRNVYYNIEDFPPSLLAELFRNEPAFLDKECGEDVRELLAVQATHYIYKGKYHFGETWFTISAENRFICKELLDTVGDYYFRKHDLIDYADRLFSPVANPVQHSITIGDYTLYYKHTLYYNLTLMLLIDADKKFLSGKKVRDKAVCYPEIQITEEIENQYGISVNEDAKAGIKIESGSYAVLDDFNSPVVFAKRTGWFEVRIIDGTFRTDSATPYSITGMKEAKQSDVGGCVWPSIIPGTVLDDGAYISGVPFDFLHDADDLTIRGSEYACELYVCRLKNGWGGIKFKLRNKKDYYHLATWLILVLSSYCSIIRGWSYHSLIARYWPTYPLSKPDTAASLCTTDKLTASFNIINEKAELAPVAPTLHPGNQGRRITASKKEQFLLDAFDLLKTNYSTNRCSLWDLIGQMAKINRENAVLMWKELMASNREVLHSSNDFGFSIMYSMEEAIGREWTYRLVAEDDELRNAVYSELGDMTLSPLRAIQFFVLVNAVYLADELLELAFTNKYRCNSFYEILDSVIPDFPGEHISDEGFELLMKWIDKVEGPEEKAKLNLKMLNYMDEAKE